MAAEVRGAVWLSFWFLNRPSADTVTYLYRAHYHQLVIAMLKSSYHNEFFQWRSPVVKSSYEAARHDPYHAVHGLLR